jgi:hypothetical protein
MSELELSLFRAALAGDAEAESAPGRAVPRSRAGYVKTGRDRIEKDPDQQVRVPSG